MLRTGQSRLQWEPRTDSDPVRGMTTRLLGREASYGGMEGGPVVRVDFVTLEGRTGWMTYIVPRRILRGEFPDTLHEILSVVFTAAESYDN